MQEYTLKIKALAYIDAYRNISTENVMIVKMIVELLGVLLDYVEDLIAPVLA